MDSRLKFFKFSLLLILFMALLGCGGGGGDDSNVDNTDYSSLPFPFSGFVAKGAIKDAIINIYSQDGQTLLIGGIRTDENGKFQTELLPDTEFPVLVKSSGGSYTDEYTGQLVQLSDSDNLYAYINDGAPITPFSNAVKVTVDKMVAEGYAPDIKTALDRALFQYTRMLGVNPSEYYTEKFTGQDTYSNLLGGFSKLVNDLNTHHAGAVPVFDLIKDMIHDLGNDGMLDGVGAQNGLTSIFSGGAGDLANATDDYLSSINMLSSPTQISPIDFDQTLFVVTNIVGPGGSLVVSGPDASLVHGGTIYEPKSVSFSYRFDPGDSYLTFLISTSETTSNNEVTPSNPPPDHLIDISEGSDGELVYTHINIYESEPIFLAEGSPDYDLSPTWTSSYNTDIGTVVTDVPGLSFDLVNQRILFNDVSLYKYTNAIYTDGLLINPPISIILNGEITY